MKLSDVKKALGQLERLIFELPDGTWVPEHFHVTEVGKVTKHFIDCGGTLRQENVVNFQLWESNDYNHRLHPEKLTHIIELSEKVLTIEDWEVEVEYQGDTIGKYDLQFDGLKFLLVSKKTDCLARDTCGVPAEKPKLKLADIAAGSACSPNSGCC